MERYGVKTLATALLAFIAMVVSASPCSAQVAAGEADAGHRKNDLTSGDHAVIVRKRKGNGAETVTREVLSWDEYVALYLDGVESSQGGELGVLSDSDDFYETIVPTPPPPSPIGFQPGDTATLTRSAIFEQVKYTRETIYKRRDGSDGLGDWSRTKNGVSEQFCGVSCTLDSDPPTQQP